MWLTGQLVVWGLNGVMRRESLSSCYLWVVENE